MLEMGIHAQTHKNPLTRDELINVTHVQSHLVDL